MKSILQSKTMWFNGLTLMASFIMVLQDTVWLSQYGGTFIMTLAIVNLGLRFVTSKAIK